MEISFADHYLSILSAAEGRTARLLRRQNTDSASPHAGGFINDSDGLYHPGTAAGSLITLVPAYVHPESPLRRDAKLAERIGMVFDFCRRVQHEDGTFDLLTTNFHSSPDNGFIMHNLGRAWKVLEAYGDDPGYGKIKERLYDLIEKTAAGMIRGGFHTPNHRWVIAAALALSHGITGDAEHLAVANQYLAEGIDCDENGEYTERSSGVYNAVNDNALIILSDELERPELLEHVSRNINMMFTYLEPDGSIFTWNSTRQDNAGQGAGKIFPSAYYHIYLMMLGRKPDPRYAWAAETIFRQSAYENPPSSLWLFMLEPGLQKMIAPADAPAANHERHYKSSGIVRIKREDLTITLMENSSSFLFLSAPDLRVRIKMCASFFGKGQVIPGTVEKVENAYILTYEAKGDYRQPLDPPPATPYWNEMDHSRREHVGERVFSCTIAVNPRSDGVELQIETAGCEGVPAKLELIADPGSVVKGDCFVLEGGPGQGLAVTGGMVELRRRESAFLIGPAFGEHHYTRMMRGSDPASQQELTLYFTGTTPLRRQVTITSIG